MFCAHVWWCVIQHPKEKNTSAVFKGSWLILYVLRLSPLQRPTPWQVWSAFKRKRSWVIWVLHKGVWKVFYPLKSEIRPYVQVTLKDVTKTGGGSRTYCSKPLVVAFRARECLPRMSYVNWIKLLWFRLPTWWTNYLSLPWKKKCFVRKYISVSFNSSSGTQIQTLNMEVT